MNELYAMLPLEARLELQKDEQSRTVPSGTNLIEHGVLPDWLVILNSGKVQVSVPSSQRGAALATAQTGKVFGMRSAVSGEPPEIDVTCLEACRVTLVPRQNLVNLLKSKPEIYFAIAKVLSTDLQIANHLLRSSMRRPAPRAV